MLNVLIYGNGMPDSIDCSIAYFGFEELNSTIIMTKNWFSYDKEEIEKFDVCVAGVDFCRFALSKMRLKDFDISCYPEQLNKFLHRNVEVLELKDICIKIPANKFFKPVKPKRFQAFKSESFNLNAVVNLDDHEKIYMCDLIDFSSEWRVYVKENKIQLISNYSGDPAFFPDTTKVKEMIDSWKGPCCYALDVGIVKDETVLVEVNDFYSIGNYGLYPRDYAEMLFMRWTQLKNGNKFF